MDEPTPTQESSDGELEQTETTAEDSPDGEHAQSDAPKKRERKVMAPKQPKPVKLPPMKLVRGNYRGEPDSARAPEHARRQDR
jgi:hypothetical protein